MGEENMKERWVPETPALNQEQITCDGKHQRSKRKIGRGESRDGNGQMPHSEGQMPDDMSRNDIGASIRKTRRLKRHRPKVLNENKLAKISKPSTPEVKTPKPRKQVRKKVYTSKKEVHGRSKRSCKRNLTFDEESSVVDQKAPTMYGTTEVQKTIKKKRKMRRRPSLEKLIRLAGMIHAILRKCEFTILNISWKNLKMRRSRMTHTRRLNLACFLLKCGDAHKSVEQCEHSQQNVKETIMHEPVNVLPYQDDAVQQALADFATQKMASLCIGDECDKPKEMQLWDQRGMLAPRHNKPKIDIDEESTRSWKLFLQGVEDTEEKNNDKKDDRETFLEEERKLFVTRVDSFNILMFAISGDRRFIPWKGSVVDSVVGVFLTQNVSDNLSSNAFLDLAARYPSPSLREQNGGDAIDYIIHEPISPKREESNPNIEGEISTSFSTTKDTPVCTAKATLETKNNRQNIKGGEEDWDKLRKTFSDSNSRNKVEHNADIVDWKAVREASFGELAEVIRKRGMSNQLAGRIKNFLDRLVRDHGSIDLEWLRNVPPLKAKSYLLSISGLGLKSTECVRLLSLYKPAFPVDVNVCRVLVRLGWVKLQPLPEDLPIHLLNEYPDLSKAQEYIWPRICNLNEQTLYEFHCYMNIFSKAFCTKLRPNCNACPMKGECKHYASALASSRLLLDDSQVRNGTSNASIVVSQKRIDSSIENYHACKDICEPIIEFPASPELETTELIVEDIEDFGCESKIQTIILNSMEMSKSSSLSSLDNKSCAKSKTLFDPKIAQIPMPKVKNKHRLRTEHQVYMLPDSHPLLAKFERRDLLDHCPYLLAIWISGSYKEPKNECESQGESTISSEDEIVKGTILIPCRTANRGQFPLNGTYFQINEVFADHESTKKPIDVPRAWIWNLRRLTLYCGKSIANICRGMSFSEIAHCLIEGYICVREFDLRTRKPKPLAHQFHFSVTKGVDD